MTVARSTHGVRQVILNSLNQDAQVNAILEELASGSHGVFEWDMTSDANYTLLETVAGGEQPPQVWHKSITISDTSVLLTTARQILVPARELVFYFFNNTAKSLTVKTSGGTGPTILAGAQVVIECDGTDCREIELGGGAAVTIIVPAGTTHTATGTNNAGLVIFNSASDCTLTVPQTSAEALDAGFHVLVMNKGGGNVKIAKQGSDTLAGISLSADTAQPITVIKETAGSPNAWRIIGNNWMPSAVENDALTAPPATPAVGAVYIPAATATGSWATHEDDFAIHIGSDVYEFANPAGVVYEKTSALFRGWTGTAWANV